MARRTPTAKTEVNQTSSETEQAPVSFEVWFTLHAAETPERKPWHREMIRAFMKAQGLSENEEKQKFDQAFKRF